MVSKNNKSVQVRVNEFVYELLEYYRPSKIRDCKVIHESLWGTNIYQKHEIAILDSPLLQRLRHIAQTGLVYLTYPSATHSRFEHTLGTISLVERFVDSINENARGGGMPIKKDPFRGDYATLRMAALLHDCGHTFLSHVSEMIYEDDEEIKSLLKSGEFAHAKAHEIFSYYIVTSKAFQDFYENYIRKYYGIDVNLGNVAKMIVGKVVDKERAFLTRIINGSFDVDKLDYISRDGYFSGLNLTLDLDRLFFSLTTHKTEKGFVELAVNTPVPLEHILFSKMLLYTCIYNHQKVKACDCMLEGLIEYIRENDILVKGYSLRDPVNFL